MSTAGREVLRAFERNAGRSGVAKLFEVEKISGAEKTGEKFDQALRMHNPNDSAMVEIFATLPKP